MKTFFKVILISLLVVYGCSTYRLPYPERQGRVTMQLFYDELSPYGDWVHNRQYGYVWIPHAGRNFLPYATNGHWIMTDYGWTWYSDYEWGWAPFHYGRWDFDPNYGWFWFPGDEWAPAWVEWRYGNGYYGWAPLTPDSHLGSPFESRFNEQYRWVFLRENDLGRSGLQRYYVNQRRNDDLIRQTTVLRSTPGGGSRYAYNPGPDPYQVERATGRKIRRVSVLDSSRPGRKLSNNSLEIYRPRIEPSPSGERPAPVEISDVKNIRPMRDRNSNYDPAEPPVQGETRQYEGQGRKADTEEERMRKEREVQRRYREKQVIMERKKQEAEEIQRQKQLEDGRRSEPEKEFRQQRNERVQRTDQQRKEMQKQRETGTGTSDTSKTRRTEQVRSSGSKRR